MGDSTTLNPMSCNNCGKKLAEIKVKDGIVSIKCKCGYLNIIEIKPTESTKSTSR